MSQLLHLKDEFGNDMWFGDTGEVRMAAMTNIEDYAKQLPRIRDVKLRPDDVIVVGYPKSGRDGRDTCVCLCVCVCVLCVCVCV